MNKKLPIVKMDVCRKYITLTLNKAEQICAGSADAYEGIKTYSIILNLNNK